MIALDLFCGAGGVSVGLHRAGFEVVGMDIAPQPHYPFRFVQGDVLGLADTLLRKFDFIWASPPCQAYTSMQRINTRAAPKAHPRLIEPVRQMLRQSGKPSAMENVPGAPLLNPIQLCGSMFGLKVRRHRLFECSFPISQPPCQHGHERSIAVYGDHPQQPGDKTYRVNRARTLKEGQDAMGIDWMPWKPLTQAIPPAYAEYVARQALQ